MKALVIYFSGTGNTELVTTEIISRLKQSGWDAEAVSIEKLDYNSRDFNFNLRTMDLIGFGFPVYKFSYPEIMEQIFPFLSNLKPSPKPFFLFATYCRFASTSLHRMARAVELCGTAEPGKFHVPVAMQSFKCPSNGIASLKDPESRAYREVMYFSPGADRLLDDFTGDVISGFARYHTDGIGLAHRGSPIDRKRERLVEKIEQSRYPRLEITPDCINCGLCARRCPDGNLEMIEQDGSAKMLSVKDPAGCLHCLRCLHICPKKAITFGPLVTGPSRYTPKVRKKLFSRASELEPGSPEPGTRAVKLRWALGNLRDYLF